MPEQAPVASSTGFASWVGIAASAITLLLTVYNAYTKAQIDASELRLKEQSEKVDLELKERAADLDASKDRTGRYTFVRTLLPDLLSKDAAQRSLSVNLIRLALTDEESAKLFNGFVLSDDRNLQAAGNEAITALRRETSQAQTASDLERQGYEALVKSDFAAAVRAFDGVEKAYPSYHSAREIGGLLRARQADLADPKMRRDVLKTILDDYSWKAPADLVAQLRKASQK